jgi:hypothetical protein
VPPRLPRRTAQVRAFDEHDPPVGQPDDNLRAVFQHGDLRHGLLVKRGRKNGKLVDAAQGRRGAELGVNLPELDHGLGRQNGGLHRRRGAVAVVPPVAPGDVHALLPAAPPPLVPIVAPTVLPLPAPFGMQLYKFSRQRPLPLGACVHAVPYANQQRLLQDLKVGHPLVVRPEGRKRKLPLHKIVDHGGDSALPVP